MLSHRNPCRKPNPKNPKCWCPSRQRGRRKPHKNSWSAWRDKSSNEEEQKSEEAAKIEEQVSKKREEKSEVKGGKRSEKKMKRRKSSRGREEYKIMFIEFWSRCILGWECRPRPWQFWITWWTTCLRGWLMRRRGWVSIRHERRCRRGKFTARWGWFLWWA